VFVERGREQISTSCSPDSPSSGWHLRNLPTRARQVAVAFGARSIWFASLHEGQVQLTTLTLDDLTVTGMLKIGERGSSTKLLRLLAADNRVLLVRLVRTKSATFAEGTMVSEGSVEARWKLRAEPGTPLGLARAGRGYTLALNTGGALHVYAAASLAAVPTSTSIYRRRALSVAMTYRAGALTILASVRVPRGRALLVVRSGLRPQLLPFPTDGSQPLAVFQAHGVLRALLRVPSPPSLRGTQRPPFLLRSYDLRGGLLVLQHADPMLLIDASTASSDGTHVLLAGKQSPDGCTPPTNHLGPVNICTYAARYLSP
jgi:hypothetical protein